MKFTLLTAAVVALAADGVVASTWFSKAAYNKWHETELERWLSDHNIPYPTPADRKDLADLVKNNWEENVARPYNSWDTNQLSAYLTSQGKQAKKGAEKNKDSLLNQVQQGWTETSEQASSAYDSVQNWIFDSWTESQVKAFLDYHGIPNPTPRTRDSLLQTARSNYQSIANKAGETAAYPGDWLYQSWSESDLKAWADERGIPVPQPSTRDKLIASVRRNSRSASNKAAAAASSLSSSAANAQQTLTDELINSWSESQLKQWADENGIKVPQGSKKNELVALVRKHRARASASATSGFGAATTSAGNAYAQATNDLYDQGKQWFDWAKVQIGLGSEEAKVSISSISSAASSFASSVSSVAERSASSASSQAAKTSGDAAAAANSARAEVSKSASSASKSLSKSAASASKGYAASAKSITSSIKNEL
ncbi:hypothetical protein K461DRAFT_320997 [Myriangium duriaei CBS 260.36]|uniref:SAP domain-containing protein n=1 Tax=Myriangium duriaei CBS 260.36 TaxID=1168546 RepID=A0A9P4MHM7_9PEZI|nr:hypothetical protein K461DRAFT_320997 [Myriangium duriaei CBS 260.36]